jgi:ABC-type glycerol-3-phosphate transport system substrate-binding protein
MVRAGYQCPTQGWGLQSGWFPFLYQNGAGILNEDMTRTDFDSEAGLEALNYYHDLLWVDKVDLFGGIAAAQGDPLLVGTAAMGAKGSGTITQLENNFPELVGQLAIAPPTARVRQAALLACDRHFISGDSKHSKVAWEFLMFLMRPETQLLRFDVFGMIPPLKSFLESPKMQDDPLRLALVSNIDIGVQWPPTPKWNDFRSFVPAMNDEFMAQEGPVDEIVKRYAEEINTVLQGD